MCIKRELLYKYQHRLIPNYSSSTSTTAAFLLFFSSFLAFRSSFVSPSCLLFFFFSSPSSTGGTKSFSRSFFFSSFFFRRFSSRSSRVARSLLCLERKYSPDSIWRSTLDFSGAGGKGCVDVLVVFETNKTCRGVGLQYMSF